MSLLFVSKTLGLCNRLRGLLNAWAFSKEKKYKFYVFWKTNEECPYEFTELFEILPSMEFVNDENGDFEIVTDDAGCIEEFSKLTNKKRGINEILILYSFLKPIEKIRLIIEKLAKEFDITKCAGIQIRRTDHLEYAIKNNCLNPDSNFELVIEHIENKDCKIYLACDCKETQDYYINKYGDKIIFYNRIQENNELRKTDGIHAVVDLYLLSFCKLFYGTFASSFSKHILYLQDVWKVRKDIVKKYIK